MDGLIRRSLATQIEEALADTPVVVLQGPRQCGKSTLVKEVCDLPYVTLDDSLSLDAALRSPASFLKSHPNGMVIDEVQRAPTLSRSIKQVVDEDRRPGKFVLTGSANIMALPKLSDSLAGRMEVVSLWPLGQGEIEGRRADFASWAFSGSNELPGEKGLTGGELTERLFAGGFPEPVTRSSAKRRSSWFENYQKALVERDVRELADIEGLAALPRLLRRLAQSQYDVVNVASLSRDTGLPASTLTRYLALLEGVFLVKTVPAWTATRQGKASKTGRLSFVDSGQLLHLLSAQPGSELPLFVWEGFAAMELAKQAGWSDVTYEVRHFRSVRQFTVPIVLERRDGQIIGLVVIDRPVAEPEDFRALEFLKEISEPDFCRGIVITLGGDPRSVTQEMSSLPISALWRV